MGLDITIIGEARRSPEIYIAPKWEPVYFDWDHERVRVLFYVLGGVGDATRFNGIEPIGKARGIPQDSTWSARIGDADTYSNSWVSLAEIESYNWASAGIHPRQHALGRAIAALEDAQRRLGGASGDVRLVFGFNG